MISSRIFALCQCEEQMQATQIEGCWRHPNLAMMLSV
jgi:hypothetical protein